MTTLPRPSTQENVSTTLSSGITDVAGTMDVADASKIVHPCYLVIDRVDSSGTAKSTSLWEYIKVTNVVANTLTITRGQNGSTAQAHSSGAVVEAVVTSAHFEDWYNALNPEHTDIGTHVMGTATVSYLEGARMALTSIASVATMRVTTMLGVSGASIVGFPTETHGEKNLGATYTISALDTWESVSNLAASLNSGKYLITGLIRANINSTTGAEGIIAGRLINATASTVVGPVVNLVQGASTGVNYVNTSPLNALVTIASLATICVQVRTVNTTDAATKQLPVDGNGDSVIQWLKLT